jgi:serine/threonine-protein kinase HipA
VRETSAGWALSPAFDLNPDPQPGPKLGHTAIDFDAREARIDTVLRVAPLFRLNDQKAAAVLSNVVTATRGWRQTAHDAGLQSSAIDRMARAFEHEETERALILAA